MSVTQNMRSNVGFSSETSFCALPTAFLSTSAE